MAGGVVFFISLCPENCEGPNLAAEALLRLDRVWRVDAHIIAKIRAVETAFLKKGEKVRKVKIAYRAVSRGLRGARAANARRNRGMQTRKQSRGLLRHRFGQRGRRFEQSGRSVRAKGSPGSDKGGARFEQRGRPFLLNLATGLGFCLFGDGAFLRVEVDSEEFVFRGCVAQLENLMICDLEIFVVLRDHVVIEASDVLAVMGHHHPVRHLERQCARTFLY